MKYVYFVIALLSFCVCVSNGRKLPSFIKRCERNDPDLSECMKNALLDFKAYLPKGVKQLKIAPMEPYTLQRSSFDASWVKAIFTNLKLYNSYDYDIDGFKIDLDNDEIALNLTQRYMELKADYRLEGQLLQFGILGEGELNANLTDTKTRAVMRGSKIQKKGQEYLNLEKIDFKILTDSLEYFYFHNLFRDHPQLTDRIHKLFQENRNELAVEIIPIFEEIIGKIYFSFFKNVFDTFSLKELFV